MSEGRQEEDQRPVRHQRARRQKKRRRHGEQHRGEKWYAALFADAKLDAAVTLPWELAGRHHVYHQYVIRIGPAPRGGLGIPASPPAVRGPRARGGVLSC